MLDDAVIKFILFIVVMPYLLTKAQRTLKEVSYHSCMDEIAEMGIRGWPGEEGGYLLGRIDGNRAYPTGFLRSPNQERRMFNVSVINGKRSGGSEGSATDVYRPAIMWENVSGGVAGVHTHPTWPAFCRRNPSKVAPPSDGDVRHLWFNKIPFEVIATAYPWEFAYLKAFGLRVDRSHRRSDINGDELGIIYDEHRFAGILYRDGERIFIRDDSEADEVIAKFVRS